MHEVVTVDPSRCRLWEYHSRLEEYLTPETCLSEIASFRAYGQLLPVLARRLPATEEHNYEVICGARRLFVARHLQVPVRVEVRKLTDREAAIALEIENSQRKELSAYERGRGLARWLAAGYFESQDGLAKAIGLGSSQVSRLLKVARLPNVVIGAFSTPDEICESWGLDLSSAWDDTAVRPLLAAKARRMTKARPKPKASEIYAQLIATTQPQSSRVKKARDEVVLDASGEHLFRIRHHPKAVALVISNGRLGSEGLNKVKDLLTKILQDGTSQVLDLKRQTRRRSSILYSSSERAHLGG